MTEEILDDVKLILGIEDDSKDELLSLYVTDTENAVTAYCRLEFVPKQLWGLVARIAAEIYSSGDTNVSAVTEGDRKIEYRSEILTDTYKSRLEPFKSICGRMPSEVKRYDA